MPSLTHRRLTVLEQMREKRDVPAVVVMKIPLSHEDEARAAEHRRRGSTVVFLSEDELNL